MALTGRERIALLAAAGVGLAAGLGVFTFGYAKGASYLTNDPAACANCHIMSEHFAAWQRGSHRVAATCNDCHTPHDLVGKYVTKARNGFWHSFYFTTGRYPDPLRITERNRRVTEGACRYCHREIVDAIDPVVAGGGTVAPAGAAHGSPRSIASVAATGTSGMAGTMLALPSLSSDAARSTVSNSHCRLSLPRWRRPERRTHQSKAG